MAERIFQVVNKGRVEYETHLADTETVSVNGDTVEIGSSLVTSFLETREVDEANDNTPGPLQHVAVVEGGPAAEPEPAEEELVLGAEEVTKAELQQLLRDKDLPVSGSKQELLDRLNDAG